MAAPGIVLRDIHQPPAPPWWPPAPGWWLLAAVLLAVAILVVALRVRRRRRRRRLEQLFDGAVQAAAAAPERVAVMSELLRRAARRRDPAADRMQGEAWLDFLDAGDAARPFTAGPGRLLLDGGFRPALPEADVDALERVARARFLVWMEAR